jgi:hypothetical protein
MEWIFDHTRYEMHLRMIPTFNPSNFPPACFFTTVHIDLAAHIIFFNQINTRIADHHFLPDQ